MSEQRHGGSDARLRTLFDQALQLDDDARQQWLANLRQNAPADAEAVQRLLARDKASVDPFGGAIDAMRRNLELDDSDWMGREVGGFRILRLLGTGGMGSVFLAKRQMRDFEQLVALKLLRAMWLDDSTLRRFADERQILARLHHPYIATLIDAGTADDGRPFLAMEYVDGETLARYCDQTRLDLPSRIDIARLLLGALAYAHRQLVVHRDLKPANVLVTADGTPKLLDFGIARLLEPNAKPGATATRALTPAYASPEQLAGEPASTASDLYSFGLILYELCVGVLPWDPGTRPGTTDSVPTSPVSRFRHLEVARREELATRRGTTPARIRRSLRGDLGRILARCLEPDPARRYASADALHIDLGEMLASRPPPGVQVPPVERAMAFVRRHAWPVAAAGLLLLAGAALLVQSLRAAHSLAIERDRAVAAAEAAGVQAAKAEQVAAFAQAMLSGIDPNRARGMDRSLMRLVLDEAAQRAEKQLDGQPEVRAAIERTIGESYNAIGEYPLAVQHMDAAIAAAEELADSVPAVVAIRARKARALVNAGEMDRAIRVAHKAFAEAGALPTTSRDRLFAQSTLAGIECDIGRFQECRDLYAKVYARQKQVLGANDGEALSSAMELAFAEDSLGHPDRAQELYRQVIASRRAESDGPSSYLLAAINALAVSYMRQQRFVDAETLLRPALADSVELFGPDHPTTINMRSSLGGAIRQQPGRNAEARPYYEQTLATYQTMYGADDRHTVYAHTNLALLLRDAGELDDALEHSTAAVESARRILPATSPILGMVVAYAATVRTRRGEYRLARRDLDEAWGIYQATEGFGADHHRVQELAGFYARLFEARNMPEKAAQWRKRAGETTAAE